MRLLVIVIEVLADLVTWLTVVISSLVGIAVDGNARIAGGDDSILVAVDARPCSTAGMHLAVVPRGWASATRLGLAGDLRVPVNRGIQLDVVERHELRVVAREREAHPGRQKRGVIHP